MNDLRPGVIKRYITQVGLYGSFAMFMAWVLGIYDEATTFFEQHKAVSVIAIVVHGILFMIGELAWSEKRALRNLKEELLRSEDHERDG